MADSDQTTHVEAQLSAPPDPVLMRQIDGLFARHQVEAVLKIYPDLPDSRLKHYTIGRLVEGMPRYRIGPLLAIGAMEPDKRIFHHMIRLLSGGDHAQVCQQIDLSRLSPALRRVGVVVLGQLKSRAALPRLQEALKCNDPVVRSVALQGIAGVGQAALSYVSVLVGAVRGDPHPGVRLDAAKAIDAMGTLPAYDALQAAALESHLDPPVLEVLEQMRRKLDPDGTRLTDRVALLRQKAERIDNVTSRRIREAEEMVAAQQRARQRAREKAARDPEALAARKRKERLSKALIYLIVVGIPAAYLTVRYLWPVLRLVFAAVVPEEPYDLE